MNCAWKAYLNILPMWMREPTDRAGHSCLQEIRLRLDRPPELITEKGSTYLQRKIKREDIDYCINAASSYSPWASATVSKGYITASGGHRVGVCGKVTIVGGKVTTICGVTSLCIRVARDFPGIGTEAAGLPGSSLIIGAPGRGKTTLLRDVIRQKANKEKGAVAVVDERGELFPVVDDQFCFSPGLRTEVLTGCGKGEGLQMLIRTMTPTWVAVDEITEDSDCQGLLYAAWCGVFLLATAHARNYEEFMQRPVYRPLIDSGVFSNLIVMHGDKSWTVERMHK